jgi:hypothetical protein
MGVLFDHLTFPIHRSKPKALGSFCPFQLMDMSTTFKLLDLKVLLENLPEELPILINPEQSEYAEFLPLFQPMEPVVQHVNGDMGAAVAAMLGVAFIEDGKVVITERGPAICAVVDVLTTYLSEYPEHPMLLKWVKMISDAARKLVCHSTT